RLVAVRGASETGHAALSDGGSARASMAGTDGRGRPGLRGGRVFVLFDGARLRRLAFVGEKIASFTSDPHVNHVSLLTVTSGLEGNQALVRAHRMPFHLAATALYLVLAVWAARRAASHRVALLGMMMMPVLMYPATYYIHFIFVLPMLVDEHPPGTTLERIDPTTAKVWLLLLGLCAAQYFTVKEKDLAIHFYNASVLLMAAILGILIVLVQRLLADEAVGQTAVDASGVLLTTGAPAAVAEIAPTEDTGAEAEARAETPE